MDIEALLQKLFSLHYRSSGYDLPIISSSKHTQVETAVREWAIDQSHELEATVGRLEAKVTVYEKIIGNSNFGPLIAPLVEEPETDNEFMKGDGDECNT